MLNIQERVPTTIQNPNADEKILFNDATDGKLKTKDSSGVIEELSTDLVGVPTGGATGEVLAKASATDGDVEWIDPTGGVKEYVALLTQTGTDAPVATVLKNTLGGTIVWTYSNFGRYIGTLAGAFTANTIIDRKFNEVINEDGTYTGGKGWFLHKIDVNSVYLKSINTSEAYEDDIITVPQLIKIEVYP